MTENRQRRAPGRVRFDALALVLGSLLAAAPGRACDVAPAVTCPTAPFHSADLVLDNHLKPFFIDSRLIWDWGGFPATLADFGSPDATTNFELCIYDYVGGTPSVRYAFSIPADGRCGDRPCWKRTTTGWSYRNPAGAPECGVNLTFQATDFGVGDVVIKGSGPSLAPFGLPLAQDPEVIAQLNSSDGLCWTTYFHDATRNYGGQFMARSE